METFGKLLEELTDCLFENAEEGWAKTHELRAVNLGMALKDYHKKKWETHREAAWTDGRKAEALKDRYKEGPKRQLRAAIHRHDYNAERHFKLADAHHHMWQGPNSDEPDIATAVKRRAKMRTHMKTKGWDP